MLFCTLRIEAIQSGNIEYNAAAKLFDYSKLDIAPVLKEADTYFDCANQQSNKIEKEKLYELALGKYFLASKINHDDVRIYTQQARIYDEMKKDTLAKSNFFHAANLNSIDPYNNFWFGEFYFKRKDYKRALKYYTIAYNNGYSDNFELNLRLATIYEKFADLLNAKRFYEATFQISPENGEIQQKIQLIDSLNYDSSEYYHFIRE